MAYYTEITSSQAWTCPKTGDYKITCVAGGGGIENDVPTHGESTSFGTYMTCSGHIVCTATMSLANVGVNGYIPICPEVYGTPAHTSEAIGYGAAGALRRVNAAFYSYCGKLERKIVHLEKGTTIACTIGRGAISSGGENASGHLAGTSGFISIQEV